MNSPTVIYENEVLESPFFKKNDTVDEVIEIVINYEVQKSKVDENTRIADLPYFNYFEDQDLDKLNSDLTSIIATRKQTKKDYTRQSQKWIGHVIEIKEYSFIAKLEDLSSGGTYEMAEFDKEEVSSDDIELFGLGAVFYWSVSSFFNKGQVEKRELLRFQRVSPLTVEECNSFADKANELNNSSSWDE